MDALTDDPCGTTPRRWRRARWRSSKCGRSWCASRRPARLSTSAGHGHRRGDPPAERCTPLHSL